MRACLCARVSSPYSQRRLQILASHVEIRDHMPILVVSDVTMSSTFERYKTRCPSLAHRRSESAMLRRLRRQLRRGSRRILLRDHTKRGKRLSSHSSRTHFATDVLSPSNLGGLFSAGAIHKTNGTALPFRAIPLDSHRVERMFSARFCGIGEIISATLNRKNPFWYHGMRWRLLP